MDSVFRKLSANDVKKLVVRTTTNFEVDQDVVSRITSEAELSNFPTNNPYFPDYQNPQPSTSSWPQDTLQYSTNQSVIGESDPLKLESPYSYLSETRAPYEQLSVSDPYSPNTVRNYYSPDTEPISPYNSEPDAPDMLAKCVRVVGLDDEENYRLNQMRDDEHAVEIQIEQNQAEN